MVTVITVHRERQHAHQEPNEILRFLKAHYNSPFEACIRLLEYLIQGKTHAVTQLAIHLEGNQTVTFRSSDDPQRVLTRGKHTMLTRYFELCASVVPENQIANTLLYQEIPKDFRWDSKSKQWVRRKRFQAALGRMIYVSPRDMEKFYLRLLFYHRKGATSFQDLRTVAGEVCPTYREVARRAGILEDDREWVTCMREASAYRIPFQLRQLFATIIVYSQATQVRELWNLFYEELSQDFAYAYRDLEGQTKLDTIQFHTRKSIANLLRVNGWSLTDFDLPQLHVFPGLVLDSLHQNSLLRRETTGYNHEMLQEIVDRVGQLNDEQRIIYHEVLDAVKEPASGHQLIFIAGPGGGTGNSTLLKHILAKVRLSDKIAIAVASSGIAPLLLMGGRTARATFTIPIQVNETSTCSIRKQSHTKEAIERASLIIWDEAPMTHRHAFEAGDRLLRDVLDNEAKPFGGKVVVLSGNFKQILPVVVRGTRAETIDACLKLSALWRYSRQFNLTENMRVRSAQSESTATELATFLAFLLRVGEGRQDVNPSLGADYIMLPRDKLIDDSDGDEDDREDEDEDEEIRPGAIPIGLNRTTDAMYADINNPEIADDDYFANRTILTTTNAMVHRINTAVGQRLEGVSANTSRRTGWKTTRTSASWSQKFCIPSTSAASLPNVCC